MRTRNNASQNAPYSHGLSWGPPNHHPKPEVPVGGTPSRFSKQTQKQFPKLLCCPISKHSPDGWGECARCLWNPAVLHEGNSRHGDSPRTECRFLHPQGRGPYPQVPCPVCRHPFPEVGVSWALAGARGHRGKGEGRTTDFGLPPGDPLPPSLRHGKGEPEASSHPCWEREQMTRAPTPRASAATALVRCPPGIVNRAF